MDSPETPKCFAVVLRSSDRPLPTHVRQRWTVASKGIETFGRTDDGWPCGTPAGENPSLMLGLAGIGHFYLRLAVPSVPSILILRREEFSSKKRTRGN